MFAPVVTQGHNSARHDLAVDLDRLHAPAEAGQVLHSDSVGRAPVTVGDLVSRPLPRDARLESERVAGWTDTEDCFQGDAVQPAGRARVPRPAAAAGVRRS